MEKCFICGHEKLENIFQKGVYKIFQCKSCKFATLSPYPSIREAKSIYQETYFEDKKTSDFLADSQQKFNFIRYLLPVSARVLDFGCGMGEFVGICRKQGLKVEGYDISKYSSRFVAKKYKVPTLSGELTKNLYKLKSFDAICAFDVIEHMPNFKTAMKFFKGWLKPGGILVLTTPDIESWDSKLLGSFWYGFRKIPEHINYFSPKSFKILSKECGFEIKQIKQWGFARSINFILNKTFKNYRFFYLIIKLLVKNLKFNHKIIFVPAVDMLVVAKTLN